MVAGAAAAAVVDGDAVGVTAAMKAGVATVLQAPGLSNPRESQRSAAQAPLTQTRCLPIGNSAAISVPAANHLRGAGPATASPGQTGEAEASAGRSLPPKGPAARRNRGFPSSVMAERAAEKERENRASVHLQELRGNRAGGAGDAAGAAENQPRGIVSAKNGCRPSAIPTTMASTAQGQATGRWTTCTTTNRSRVDMVDRHPLAPQKKSVLPRLPGAKGMNHAMPQGGPGGGVAAAVTGVKEAAAGRQLPASLPARLAVRLRQHGTASPATGHNGGDGAPSGAVAAAIRQPKRARHRAFPVADRMISPRWQVAAMRTTKVWISSASRMPLRNAHPVATPVIPKRTTSWPRAGSAQCSMFPAGSKRSGL